MCSSRAFRFLLKAEHFTVTCMRFRISQPLNSQSRRQMATVKDSIPHVVRTADDPRQAGIHRAVLSRVELVNQNIRLLRLRLTEGPVRHLPGQYVDLHIPNIDTVGGFTITSPPQTALNPKVQQVDQQIRTIKQEPYPYIELAIQKSLSNPPAAFLYRDPREILDTPVSIRIGGSFTFPPFTLSLPEFQNIRRVLFIAGGVGINPIMSMISAMDIVGSGKPGGMPETVCLLHSSRREYVTQDDEKQVGEDILFNQRLNTIAQKWNGNKDVHFYYTLFETNGGNPVSSTTEPQEDGNRTRMHRRISQEDVMAALGSIEDRQITLVYVCGHPQMTDEYVAMLQRTEGLDKKRICYEKWW